MQRDRQTGASHWPPKPLYWKGGDAWSGSRRAGAATVYTYVVAHEPFLPALQHLLPHIMVVVELEEGARIVGYMVDCTPEEMRFGLPVRVVFKRLTDRVTLPVWRPDR